MAPHGMVRCPVAMHRAMAMPDMLMLMPCDMMVMAHQCSARAVPHHPMVAHAPAPAHRPILRMADPVMRVRFVVMYVPDPVMRVRRSMVAT
jgi:hypothetical protein